MTETTTAILTLLLLLGVPISLVILPFVWYGKRHGWGGMQYMWVTVGSGLGWPVVLFGWVLKYQIDTVIVTAGAGLTLSLLVYSVLMVAGVTRVPKGQRERVKSFRERMKDPRDLLTGVLLLTGAVFSTSRVFGWSLLIPAAVFVAAMIFWFAMTRYQKSRP